jgi:hypothetical protein
MVTTPDPIPVTTPVVLIEAIVGILLDHVPPAGVATKVTEEPTHTVVLPLIIAPPVTVIVFVTKQPALE